MWVERTVLLRSACYRQGLEDIKQDKNGQSQPLTVSPASSPWGRKNSCSRFVLPSWRAAAGEVAVGTREAFVGLLVLNRLPFFTWMP